MQLFDKTVPRITIYHNPPCRVHVRRCLYDTYRNIVYPRAKDALLYKRLC